MNSSVEAVKRHYSEKLGIQPDENNIYDIRVTFDGTWQKRGHTSLLAAGAVIDAETGLVIDYESISKYCEQCTKKENALKRKKITQEQFDEWLADHKQTKVCMRNFTGSSGAMEAAAAVKLFGRSVEKNLRYTVFISDGHTMRCVK